MKITIKFAEESEIKQVREFFKNMLFWKEDILTSYEWTCPFWLSSAIKKNEVIILKAWDEILGGFRFYKRKTDDVVSLYQFAIDEKIRWKWLLKKMFGFTWYKVFESLSFSDIDFNKYYEKTWWKLEKSDDKFNYWRLYTDLDNK